MERTMQFTVTVTLPAELAEATAEWVGNEIENMIENNSNMTALVEPAGGQPQPHAARELLSARPPKWTRTAVGDEDLWRTEIMGAITAGRACATCGGGRKLSVFTVGQPVTAPGWWAGLPLHCSVSCWTQGA